PKDRPPHVRATSENVVVSSRRHFMMKAFALLLTVATMFGQAPAQQKQPPAPMTFFVTSVGAGNGGNLGGLAGADAHCQKLTTAAGAGNRTWRAYLSTSAADGKPAVNARDRIGSGPWHNAKGTMVARDLSKPA